jgi:hypothetical protein
MAAVDQHGQTDRLWSPEVDEGVHRGADRPARVQHVVDENDGPPIDAEREIRAFDDWLLRDEREVVAVEGDVECTDRDVDRFVLAIASAMRRANGTPRRWIPISSRPDVPACFSTISCERRIVARRISSAVMIRRPVIRTFLASLGHAGGLTGPRAKGQTRGYRATLSRRGP